MKHGMWVILGLLGLGAAPAWAGEWQVMRLAVRGSSSSVGVEVQFASAADAAWRPRTLTADERLVDGSRLRVPADVEIELRSDEGLRTVKRYGDDGELELQTSTPRRNALVVRGGEWLFWLERKLDSVSVSAGRGQAHTRNTAFAVAFDTATGAARFRVDQGSIEVVHELAVQVAQLPPLTLRPRRTLNAGDPAFVLRATADAYLVHYGSYDEAVTAFESRWRDARAAQDTDAQFNALLALGDVLRVSGRGAEALERYGQALVLVQGPADGYWRALLLGRRGDALDNQNRFAEAAAAYRDSMREHAALPAQDDEDAVNDQRANLARVHLADGTLRCAAAVAQTALARLDARPATKFHPTRAMLLALRASAASEASQLAQAEIDHGDALRLWRIIGSPKRNAAGLVTTEELAFTLNGVGDLLRVRRRLADAEASHREALAIADSLFSAPHGLQGDARLGLARVLIDRGRRADALAEVARASAVFDAAPPDLLRRGDADQMRGELQLAAGRAADAVASLRRAREQFVQVWPDHGHPRFATLLPALAKALRARGAPEAEAREAERAALDGARALALREQACLR